jgi:cation transport ATPase
VKAYPRGFLKVFWWTQTLLAISGALLLPGMLALRLEWDVPLTVLLDSRVLLAAAHGLLAFVALLVLGALLPIHVRHGLRQHKNKRSGITLLCVFAVLTITGWGIYYLADEQWSLWTSVLHVLTALIVVCALPVHVVLARRSRRS